MTKYLKNTCLCFIVVSALFFIRPGNFVLSEQTSANDEISTLQQEINKQQDVLKELEKQIKIYETKIGGAQKNSTTLKGQISGLNDQIYKTNLEIKKQQAKIKETELKITNLQLNIQNKQKEIDSQKKRIIYLLQLINKYDNENVLEIVLLNNNVSEFFDRIKYLKNIQGALQEDIDKFKIIKSGLEIQEKDLRDKKQDIVSLNEGLSQTKQKLDIEKGGKKQLLTKTQGMEWKFQNLLAGAIREQKVAESDIRKTEALIRKKIASQQEEDMLSRLEEGIGPLLFSWPVPKNKIMSQFHDPDYPFKKLIGEHSGIDIRAEQGTIIRAPASGYVARAKNSGMGYSYIMLIHTDGLATVYGHISKIDAEEGIYVKRGDRLGLTGGIPGTSGAGSFCTGPHLHFEVRKDGLPVNPIEYLI
ncbi:MAG: peptidoglycan DD-metalloendopeptidase family protein [Patescibacteria group bacterium]